jgi:hypothetical protein
MRSVGNPSDFSGRVNGMDESLIKELKGKTCRCGASKRGGETLCSRCFYSLNKGMRASLYTRVGFGYKEAYQAAVDVLVTIGRVKPPKEQDDAWLDRERRGTAEKAAT